MKEKTFFGPQKDTGTQVENLCPSFYKVKEYENIYRDP